jgi:hypothetical protein
MRHNQSYCPFPLLGTSLLYQQATIGYTPNHETLRGSQGDAPGDEQATLLEHIRMWLQPSPRATIGSCLRHTWNTEGAQVSGTDVPAYGGLRGDSTASQTERHQMQTPSWQGYIAWKHHQAARSGCQRPLTYDTRGRHRLNPGMGWKKHRLRTGPG